LDGVAAVGRQTPISPRIAELRGKFGMELEASPRQLVEGTAATPVERQEAARFAGCCASDLVAFDDDRPRAATACEVGNRGANCTTTADHDAPARVSYRKCVRADFPIPGQAHRAWGRRVIVCLAQRIPDSWSGSKVFQQKQDRMLLLFARSGRFV